MANRRKNKEIELNRQIMSVLSVVSKKRDVKEYVFDNSSQQLLDDMSQFNFSTSQVQSQPSKEEVKKKHNEGIKIISKHVVNVISKLVIIVLCLYIPDLLSAFCIR